MFLVISVVGSFSDGLTKTAEAHTLCPPITRSRRSAGKRMALGVTSHLETFAFPLYTFQDNREAEKRAGKIVLDEMDE